MIDAVGSLIFIVLALLDVWLLRRIARRHYSIASPILQFVAGAVLFWSAVVVSAIALSTFGGLSGYWLWLCVSTILIVVDACNRCFPIGHSHENSSSNQPREFRIQSASADAWWTTKNACVALCSLILAYVFTYGIAQLPMDWDTLAYHLPLVDHWIQSGNLWSQDCAFWYCPGNNELLALFLACGFSGDFWTQLHNLLPAAILIGCVCEFARELRIRGRTTTVIVLSIIFTQPFIRQIISAENDLSVAALLLASSLFSWRYIRKFHTVDLFCFGASLGLLGGVKYYALAYVAVTVAIPVAWLILRRQLRPTAMVCLSACGGFLLLSAFWYCRNWMLADSPLFPKGILWFPDQWAEMRPGFRHSNLLNSGRSEVWPLLARAWLIQAGTIPFGFLLCSWVPFLFLINSAKTVLFRPKYGRGDIKLWVGCLSIASAAVYLITPNVVESEFRSLNMLKLQYHPVRFGLCVMVGSALALSPLINWCLKPASVQAQHTTGAQIFRCMVGAIVILGLVSQVLWQLLAIFNVREFPTSIGVYFWWPPPRRSMLPLLAVATLVAVIYVTCAQTILELRSRCLLICAAIALTATFCCATVILSDRWHREYQDHFGHLLRTNCIVKWNESQKADDRLCVVDYRYYPFIGSKRETSVCRPLWFASDEDFLEFLDMQNATKVVLPSLPGGTHLRYRDTRYWFESQVQGFEYLHVDNKFVLVRMPLQPNSNK